MKRGNALKFPHILPDDQMERMAKRAAEELGKDYCLGSMKISESNRYYFAYRMLEAVGFKAACKANEATSTTRAH